MSVSFNSRSYGLDIRKKSTTYANLNAIEERNKNKSSMINGPIVESLSLRKCSSLAALKKDHFSCTNEHKEAVNEVTYNVISGSQGMELNRVDCVVWMLHQSARNFSQAIESLGVAKSDPELTMDWIGKDVHQWHRCIDYQVLPLFLFTCRFLRRNLLFFICHFESLRLYYLFSGQRN